MICGTFTLSRVPAAELDSVVEGFEANDPPPLHVEHRADGDGSFTVTAVFPPCPANMEHTPAAATLTAARGLAATAGPALANAVVDLSHHNGHVDLERARTDGLLGVILKATQGRAFVDPQFADRREEARRAGLMFGAYHFGVAGDGVEQAQHFLKTVRPDAKTLVALDFEDNPAGGSMSLEEAHAFVLHIRGKLGRSPVFYSGHTIKRVLGDAQDAVLGACPLWLAQYGPVPKVPRAWPTWTLWQYTDGAVGPTPHEVDGIGRCDRDRFNGDEAALRTWWAS